MNSNVSVEVTTLVWNDGILLTLSTLVPEFSQFLNIRDAAKATDSVRAESAVHLSGNSAFAESTGC